MLTEPQSASPSAVRRHELKAQQPFFDAVFAGTKAFEIRKNDRGFAIGDILVLREWSVEGGYTSRSCERVVTYMTDFHQEPGFVVMGIAPFDVAPPEQALQQCLRYAEQQQPITDDAIALLSLASAIRSLQRDNVALRAIFPRVLEQLKSGGCTSSASVSFLERIPDEVGGVVGGLRAQLAATEKQLAEAVRLIEERPRASGALVPAKFQRLWEACIHLSDKADFKVLFNHAEKCEQRAKKLSEALAGLKPACEKMREAQTALSEAMQGDDRAAINGALENFQTVYSDYTHAWGIANDAMNEAAST